MKKRMYIFVLALLLVLPLQGQDFFNRRHGTVRHKFAAQSSTGATPSIVARVSPSRHTVQLLLTGGPTGCAYQLEGSLDNSNWENLSGTQDCTSVTMFHVVDRPVNYIRGNLTTLSGGSSPTVQFLYAGVR